MDLRAFRALRRSALVLLSILASASSGCGGPQTPPEGEGRTTGEPASEPDLPGTAEPAATPDATAAPSASADAVPEPPSKAEAVELVYVETKKKGAQSVLYFDVTVRNARTAPRWLLLPSVIHATEGLGKGAVNAVEIHSATAEGGAGKLTLGRFKGPGAFQSVLVPASGEMKLSKVPITCTFSTVKDCVVPIQVVLATDFSVGDQKAGDLVKGDNDKITAASIGDAKQVSTKPIAKAGKPTYVDSTQVNLRFILSGG